jgi:flagellar biosynthesis protein FlhG
MVDQAQNLREFMRENRRRAHVVAVTSGKGGVGKTSTSVNLAIALAQRGRNVVLLDADLGLANVEVLLGLTSVYNLQHVISGEKRLVEVLVPGPGGIMVVPGSSGLARLADLGPVARTNILNGLEELQESTDYIIIDTMAGIGQNAVSFCVAADEVLLVCTPEPSSIVDAYAMLKTICQMRDDATLNLVVNMAGSDEQAQAVADKFSNVSQQFLGRPIACIGCILRDPHVSQAVMQTNPFLLRFPNAPASRCVHELAGKVIYRRAGIDFRRPSFFKRFAQSLGLASNA